MSWTPGDVDLIARKIQGPGIQGAAGIIVRDSTAGGTKYVVSMRQYAKENARQKEASKRRPPQT